MSDIFEEISQDIQKEKFAKFWKKYNKKLKSFGTFLIILLGVGLYWQHRQGEILQEASSDYGAAVFLLDMGHPERALRNLEVIPQKTGHAYVALSSLLGGNILKLQKDYKGASDSYAHLVKETASLAFKKIALLKLLYTKLEEGDYAFVLSQDEKAWAGDGHEVFRALGREVRAFALWKTGKTDEARVLFEELKADAQAPVSLKVRASLFLSQVQ